MSFAMEGMLAKQLISINIFPGTLKQLQQDWKQELTVLQIIF